MASHTLARTVHGFRSNGELVTLLAGTVLDDTDPDDADLIDQITNPSAWAPDHTEALSDTETEFMQFETAWHGFTNSVLRKVAAQNDVDLRGCKDKDSIIQALVDANIDPPEADEEK